LSSVFGTILCPFQQRNHGRREEGRLGIHGKKTKHRKERKQATRTIKKIDLVSRRAKLRSRGRQPDGVDGAEA
jgi:hypothetical protein